MKRAWFRNSDGTYFRNCNLIDRERERILTSFFWWLHIRRLHQLDAEYKKVWREGVARKPALGRDDVEVKMRSFREAYPEHPVLWQLDDEKYK